MRFFKKIQEFENRFCVSLLNRSIEDFSYHSASKELKNPLSEWIFFGSFEAPLSQKSWIDLFSKETQNLFSDSFGFKNPILGFLKETHPLVIDESGCVLMHNTFLTMYHKIALIFFLFEIFLEGKLYLL